MCAYQQNATDIDKKINLSQLFRWEVYLKADFITFWFSEYKTNGNCADIIEKYILQLKCINKN